MCVLQLLQIIRSLKIKWRRICPGLYGRKWPYGCEDDGDGEEDFMDSPPNITDYRTFLAYADPAWVSMLLQLPRSQAHFHGFPRSSTFLLSEKVRFASNDLIPLPMHGYTVAIIRPTVMTHPNDRRK